MGHGEDSVYPPLCLKQALGGCNGPLVVAEPVLPHYIGRGIRTREDNAHNAFTTCVVDAMVMALA